MASDSGVAIHGDWIPAFPAGMTCCGDDTYALAEAT